jgi:hypothetical protein
MPYRYETWFKRHVERSDLTTNLVHLTRGVPEDNKTDMDVLFDILNTRQLRASRKGFISGSTPVVCFQDAPLESVCQNCYFEEKFREEHRTTRQRYGTMGIALDKQTIYSAGGRPVIYDSKGNIESYLPQNQRWRFVTFDLNDFNNIVDWTHEREWRVPGDLSFSIEDAIIILGNYKDLKTFIDECDSRGVDHYRSARGIAILESTLT